MTDRLQKKCFVAATGFHLLLLTILIVGPAFLMSERKAEDMPMLDFVPTKTIDEAFSGGGSPKAQPPAPQPPPPAPQAEVQPPAPQPAPAKLPDPPKVVVKDKEPDPESLEAKTDKKPRKPEVSLKPVVRKPNTTTSKLASNEDADAKARADAKTKQQAAFRRTLNNLNTGLSSSTAIEMPPGPGGGGPSYANFYQALRKIYNDAWIVPDGITDDEATVSTSVTIARNGDVIATKILRSSGNAAVDASVEAMLRRVTHAVPLPDSAKENQRTVNIKFNVKAKLNG